MRSISSPSFLVRPISGMLLRALGLALALALLSVIATTAWGQQGSNAGGKTDCYQPVRFIDDLATGTHWLLERDTLRPGAPGRMRQVVSAGHALAAAGVRTMLAAVTAPVIRAGDRLIVTEDTPLVSARLVAVALKPAHRKERFQARLVIGGKVVDAVAVDVGRARLASPSVSTDIGKTAAQGAGK
ncbi:MAG TPA: hypothetical protein VG844_07775 [Terracidiphilus sp.]|jgi:hypothetical protein|nr:hypothetical protein [Terracidiphilus sp.]